MKKKFFTYLSLFFLFCIGYSQSEKKQTLSFDNEAFKKAIKKIETLFDVKYSYADSIVEGKKISLTRRDYSFEEINQNIEKQLHFTITPINDRFYYILPKKNIPESAYVYFLDELKITNYLVTGITKFDQKFTLHPKKMEILAGVTDEDVLLTIHQLPGIRSPNKTVTGLSVRGGLIDQNLVLWDGIRIYHSGHLFGMISPLHPSIVKSVDFLYKATNPFFGDRISSIIDLKSNSSFSDKAKFEAGINALSADGYTKIPILKNKLDIQAAFRKSITEWIPSPTYTQLAEKVFQNTSFTSFKDKNDFGFEDVSVKVDFKPSAASDFTFSGIYINNLLDYTNIIDKSITQNNKLNHFNYGFSSSWQQKYNEVFRHSLRLYYSVYQYDYKRFQKIDDDDFESFNKNNRIIDSGAEIGFNHQINKHLQTEFGYQINGQAVSHIFDNFNQDLGVIISENQGYVVSNNIYVNSIFHGKSYTIHTGARMSFFNSKSPSFEPRIQYSRALNDRLNLHASFERKSQTITQIKENTASDLSLENYIWVNNLPLQRANQTTLGLTYKMADWFIDIDAYYKSIHDISTFLLNFQKSQDLSMGSGFTKGLDVTFQKKLSPTSRLWCTYSFQDGFTKFDGVNNNSFFRSNTAINHSVTLNINKKINAFAFSIGWFWHTGRPYSLLNDEGKIEEYNSKILPSFHRLDATCSYDFQFSKMKCKIGASIQNLYNYTVIINKELERNFETIEDFSDPNYYINPYFSQGITPNVFLRIQY